ncbi:MAG: LytTR family DNA-binding domain-containing protein [Bacteroidota bacterium]
MKALIVDDEQSNIENLSTLIKQYCPAVVIAGSATNVESAAELVALQMPDLLFLDIQMGEQTGFDLLRMLPNKDFEVIFITAFDKYGIEAIKFSALDYLLKPVDIPELVGAVRKAEHKMMVRQKDQQLNFLLNHLKSSGMKPAKIALPQLHEIRYVLVDDIIRCEADNSYTTFNLLSGDRILVSKSIKEYADILKPLGFLRTHQSHLVNPAYVKAWIKEDGGVLLLNNGSKVPVSKPNKAAVQLALNLNTH